MDPGVKNLGGETKVFEVRFESKGNALKLGPSVKNINTWENYNEANKETKKAVR